MEIEHVYRKIWCESEGMYVDTDEVLGYAAVDERGTVQGYGECPEEALGVALEALWLS